MGKIRHVLIASQVTGQLSLVLVSPILTRQFSPQEFGEYQLALTVGILLQPFLTLSCETVIPSEESDESIEVFLRLIAVASCVTIGILLSGAGLHTYLPIPVSGNVWIMIASIAAAYSLTAVDNALMIRANQLGRLAARNFLSGTLVAATQIVAALWFQQVVWIAVAILAGRSSAVLLTRTSTVSVASLRSSAEGAAIDWARIGVRMVTHVAGTLSLSGLVLYSQVAFGSAATAYVGMAQRSADAPLGLVSQALSQHVQSILGETVRTKGDSLLQQIHGQMRSMVPYAVLSAVGLMIFGPLLAVPVFGPGWEKAGYIIAILGIPAGTRMLIGPITAVFFMIGAEAQLLRVQCSRFGASLLLAGAFQVAFDNLLVSVAGYGIGTVLGYGYTYIVLRRVVGSM